MRAATKRHRYKSDQGGVGPAYMYSEDLVAYSRSLCWSRLSPSGHMSSTVELHVEIGAVTPKYGTVADYHERQISVPDLNA
jgi:hypothetical protein